MAQTLENSLEPPNNVDFAFDRVEEVVHTIQNFYQWLTKVIKIRKVQDASQKFIADYPVFCVFIGVALVMCCVPVFFFFVFALTTAAVLFAGFLLVEGTILMCGLFVLSGVLFFVVCLSVITTVFILLIYYTAAFFQRISVDVKQRLIPQNVSYHTE